MSSPAAPLRARMVRTAASIAALTVGAIGIVGFASAASAVSEECVPADAVTHTEYRYAQTVTLWDTTNPGEGWEATNVERVKVAAVLKYEARMWHWNPRIGGQQHTDANIGNELYGYWEYAWFSHDHDSTGNGKDWEPTGVTRVDKAAVMEFAYTRTETTGWLRTAPEGEWSELDTRVVTDSEAVVCEATPSLTANGYRFRPGDTIDLSALDFLPGEDIEFVLNSEPVLLANASADLLGAAALRSIVIPAGTAPGIHTIVATGLTSGRTASTTIEVLPAASDPAVPAGTSTGTTPAVATPVVATDATLAETGTESLLLLGLAGSLALVGAGLVGLRRSPVRT